MNYLHQIKNINEIRKFITNKNIKIVSFDLFDTLVVRPCIEPKDIFYIVEQRINNIRKDKIFFTDLRIWAEREARLRIRKNFPGYEDITIDEIYTIISDILNLNDHEKNLYRNIELDVEMQYISPRKSFFDLYNLAVSINKYIIITTDVYLPSCFIIKLLLNKGFTNFKRCFVSSEIRLSKGSGNLFLYILKTLSVSPQQVVHIGDNKNADFINPKKLNIHSFHVPKSIDNFLNNRVDSSLWISSLQNIEPSFRMLLGLINNNIFDTVPREGWNKDSLFNGNPYILGYYGIGPFLFILTLWLIRKAISERHDIISFIARDGYIVLKIYELLRPYFPEAPNSNYIRISRSICYFYSITDKASLMTSQRLMYCPRNLTLREIIKKRFLCDVDAETESIFKKNNINIDDKCTDFLSTMEFIYNFCPNIFNNIKEQNLFADIYYNKIFSKYNNIGIFDCGYTGRAQSLLSNKLKKTIKGYYIASFDSITNLDIQGLQYSNFWGQPTNRFIDDLHFTSALLELFCSEYISGTVYALQKYDDKIQPSFENSTYPQNSQSILNAIHVGCLDFVRSVISTFKEDLQFIAVSPMTSTKIIRQFMNSPHIKDAKIFENFDFTNGLIGENKFIIGKKEESSYWKEGFLVLHKKAKPIEKVNIARNENNTLTYKTLELNFFEKCKRIFLYNKNSHYNIFIKLIRGFYFFIFQNKKFIKKFQDWKKENAL